MKKIFITLLCIIIIISMSSCITKKEEDPASDFEYHFSSNDEFAIIEKYIGDSTNVVIPQEIEGRAVSSLFGKNVDGFIEGVFEGTDVETVVIPKSVQYIGNDAFENCSKLVSVEIEENSELHTISSQAFENCSALNNINLENATKLTCIENRAFYNCSSIESIKFPKDLETIGLEAFANCSALKSINVPAKLNMINLDGASFSGVNSLEKIIFDEGRENIRGYLFFTITSNVKIVIPKGVTNIDVTTFVNNGNMNIYFLGDCPQISEGDSFSGNVTIYYDPSTNGWDTTPLRNVHTLISN